MSTRLLHRDLDVVVRHAPAKGSHASVVVMSPELWRIVAKTAYLRLCASREQFSADNVRRAVPESPSATEAAWGGIFQWGARRGYAVRVGVTTSQRGAAKYRRLPLWQGTGKLPANL